MQNTFLGEWVREWSWVNNKIERKVLRGEVNYLKKKSVEKRNEKKSTTTTNQRKPKLNWTATKKNEQKYERGGEKEAIEIYMYVLNTCEVLTLYCTSHRLIARASRKIFRSNLNIFCCFFLLYFIILIILQVKRTESTIIIHNCNIIMFLFFVVVVFDSLLIS